MFAWRALATVLVLLTWSGARADAVPPPPGDCPEGTRGATCHGGPYCAPTPCAADTDCAAGAHCVSVAVTTRDVFCNGRRPANAPPPTPRVAVTGLCGPGQDPSTCRTLKLCRTAPDPQPETPKPPATTAPPEVVPAQPTTPATAPQDTAGAVTAEPAPAPTKRGCAAGVAEGLGAALVVLALRGVANLGGRRRRAGPIAGALLFTTLVVHVTGGAARADVIYDERPECPVAGTEPLVCHGGGYCAVIGCDKCAADQLCQTVSACARDVQCAGDVNPEDLPKYLRPDVRGLCGADKTCAQGSCRPIAMCVPKPVAAEPATSTPTTSAPAMQKSGCTGGGPGPVGFAGIVTALAMFAAWRGRGS